MNGLSCVQFVGKPLPDNTIGRDMKDCIQARKSSSAKANWDQETTGAVAANSPAQMRWVVISGRKLEEYALSLCLMKRPGIEPRTRCSSSSNKHTMRQGLSSPSSSR